MYDPNEYIKGAHKMVEEYNKIVLKETIRAVKEISEYKDKMNSKQKAWKRYRFSTKSVDDYRPLIFNPKYPFWCSGYAVNSEFECESATIIAYLPHDEDLLKYWDDAFDIDVTEEDSIEFGSRFAKPDYFIES